MSNNTGTKNLINGKAQSDSERQPTSALVLSGVATILFIYGWLCLDAGGDAIDFGVPFVLIAIVLGVVSYKKLKTYKEKNGLNGIGYIVYLIFKILIPVLAISIGLVIIIASIMASSYSR